MFAAADTVDIQRRLQTQEVQSLLLEELDPGEEHHASLILLPQVVQTFTQRRQLINGEGGEKGRWRENETLYNY